MKDQDDRIYEYIEQDGTHLYEAEEENVYYGTIGSDETNQVKGAGRFKQVDSQEFVNEFHKSRDETVISNDEYQEFQDYQNSKDEETDWGAAAGLAVLGLAAGYGVFELGKKGINKWNEWRAAKRAASDSAGEGAGDAEENFEAEDQIERETPERFEVSENLEKRVFILSQQEREAITTETVKAGFKYYCGQYILTHSIPQDELARVVNDPQALWQISSAMKSGFNDLLAKRVIYELGTKLTSKEVLQMIDPFSEEEILSMLRTYVENE